MKKDHTTGRKLQARKTKRRIFHSAISLIDDHGYDNVTIEDISTKAGVSVGAFYHYYDSKSDILVELYAQIDHYYLETVTPLLCDGDVFGNIRIYFEQYAMYQTNRGIDHVRLLISTYPELFVDESRYMYILLRNIIATAQENGEITDKFPTREIMIYYLVLSRGVLLDWCIHKGAYSLDEKMNTYIEMLKPVFAA